MNKTAITEYFDATEFRGITPKKPYRLLLAENLTLQHTIMPQVLPEMFLTRKNTGDFQRTTLVMALKHLRQGLNQQLMQMREETRD